MWLYPFIFVSAAFLGMGISDFFFFFCYSYNFTDWLRLLGCCDCCGCCRWCFYLVVSQSQLLLSWLLCCPDVFFLSYLWLSFWRLVSIGWLCDLPVWLIGLGTYVINLLLFINKPVGQRSFLEGFRPPVLLSSPPLPQLNENFWKFSFTIQTERQSMGIHESMNGE